MANKDLRGKNAIVTGASRGLGVYIAKALAAEGVNVAVTARDAAKLDDVRRACEALGVKAIAVACDVRSLDDQKRLLATTERDLGPIDILVNNAGIELTEEFQMLSIAQIDDLLVTNLHAPIWLTKLALPSMLARKRGAIVNVASLAGKSPVPYNTIYGTTKAGLINFTHSLAVELEGSGVHTGVVCPSFVSEAGMWADAHEFGAKATRMVREVTPEHVAKATLRCVRGATEELVASGPIRPLFAWGAIAPGQMRSMVRRLGVKDAFKKVALRRKLGGDRPGAAASTNGATSEADRETAARV